MVSIIKPLPEALLTKNPATLQFLKKGIYSSAGAYADIKFEPNWGSLGIGALWQLEWGDKSVLLTFAATLTDNPFTVLEYASGTVDDYLFGELVPALNKIEALVNDFIIEPIAHSGSSNFYIRFRARKKGAAYNIASGSDTTITITSTINATGSDAVVLENYKLKLRLLVEENPNTEIFTKVKELEGKGFPDEQRNEITIGFSDIPALMHRYANVLLPEDAYRFYDFLELFNRFKVEVAEVYGATPATYKIEPVNPLGTYALPMGIGMAQADFYTFYNQWAASNPLKYNTWAPQHKLISKQQPEWLLLFANTTNGNITHIRVELFFNESPNTNFTIAWQPEWNDRAVLLPVGFNQLKLSQYENGTKEIVSYTVTVYDTDVLTQRAEPRHYIIDYRTSIDEKFIVFINSLNGIDTVRLRGVISTGIETEQELAENIMGEEYSPAIGTMSMVNKTFTDKFEANTGFLRKSELDYYTELLKAEHIWECGAVPPLVENKSVYAMPFKKLLLTSSKYNKSSSRQQLFSYDLAFQYAWEGTSYSEGNAPTKLLYDAFIEFTIENTAATDYLLTVWLQNAFNIQYWVNGELLTANSNLENIEIPAGEIVHIKVMALNMKSIVLTAANTALRINFASVPVAYMQRLDTVGFGNIESSFFVNKLRYAKNLLQFYTSGSIDAKNTDLLLRELVEAAGNYGNLNQVTVLGTAPSAAGLVDKAELIVLGVTTTTA